MDRNARHQSTMSTAHKFDTIDYVDAADYVDTASTARIDRRQTVLAQIEAALLANKLSVLEVTQEVTGTDPYNNHRPATGPWGKQAR
jgi:hypothetical protein